ncbi:MAG: cytochrome-c peroxidase [Bacteroidia bacterium]|nr:cytochrome-c peroxidase [Bacteroidia bacterium]
MKKILVYTAFVFAMISILMIESCKKDPKVEVDMDMPYNLEFGAFPQPLIAIDNPLTVEGVKLGRMLFYEKMLSSNNQMNCASCHNQKTAFSDTNRLSIGVLGLPGKRQAMSAFNMAWNSNEFFWDGRAHLLRDQSLKPIQDSLEMHETLPGVIAKLQSSNNYPPQFKKAFGSEEITSERMSKALEQFMNSIVSYRSKYDDYLAGAATLTQIEERGRFLFFTEFNPAFPNASGADCQHCHGGSNFENDKYANNGLDNDAGISDIGRQKVTNNNSDKAKFKVPSLRNVELTFPYMHDGRFKTLEEVVEHYNLVTNSSTLDGSFQQQLPNGGLKLTANDKAALVAFLKTLTDYKLTTDSRYSSPF